MPIRLSISQSNKDGLIDATDAFVVTLFGAAMFPRLLLSCLDVVLLCCTTLVFVDLVMVVAVVMNVVVVGDIVLVSVLSGKLIHSSVETFEWNMTEIRHSKGMT